jgi:uncharacterized LabA/DUF88 family protein
MIVDPDPRPPRLEIFVDGSNFNAALAREGFGAQTDLNVFATRLSRDHQLVKLRYYTSPLANKRGSAFHRQQRFFEELRRSRRIELVLGRHEPRRDRDGRWYHLEKETDVNLAVDMVVGAYEDRFDVAMLVAGDTDYLRAIHVVQSLGKPVVWCHLPAQRHTDLLAQTCHEKRELTEKFLRTCMLGVDRR